MANGRGVSGSGGALSANTTVQLGLAILMFGAVFSGAWWASGISNKVDIITSSSNKLETDMANVKNDVSAIKYDVKSVQNSVNQISTETIKRR